MLKRWTGVVLRHRALVLGCWLVVLVAGVLAAAQLPPRLSVSFAVPDTESDQARKLLANRFGEQPEGTFVVVFDVPRSSDAVRRALRRRLENAAAAVQTGGAGPIMEGDGVLYAPIATSLSLTEAKGQTERLREALGEEGARAYVTGEPAIQHDLDPIVDADIRRAELIAIPIALVVLVAVFGLTPAVLIPFVFAACTIAGTFAVLRILVETTAMTTYITALVELIGLGLAIDYSLLVGHRYREEISNCGVASDAVGRTMRSAGRTVVVSGLAAAIGLSVLLFVPVPLIRSLGIAGLLVPLISIAAVLTLQPVLLSLLGRTGAAGKRSVRASRSGFWIGFATSVTRRPTAILVVATGGLALASIPAFSLSLTPGSLSGVPEDPEAMMGFARLTEGVGPGAVTPIQIVVEAGPGGAEDRPTRAAIDRLADELFHDSDVLVVASGRRKPYVDAARRYARVIVIGRHEVGEQSTLQLVRRLRDELIPAAGFPDGVVVSAGGAPPQGVDFLDRAYDKLAWIVLAVLSITYVVLLRAFRSLVLPLQAVLLNLLTVTAVCGFLVLVFQWGLGRYIGVPETDAIEGWVPLLLFATLFGLSMDYEVFLVSRMREAWDEGLDTRWAVATGLERSGLVVTAAAIIMVAAFAGFAAGRIVGLQQLGLGLALGVLLDATIIRMLVLPTLMVLLGRWNWWLPPWIASLARVDPSPLRP